MEYRTLTVAELFTLTEQNSQQLRVARAAVEVAAQRRRVVQTQRLPGAATSLNLSYLGSPVILDTNLDQLQRVDIPHFGVTFGGQASPAWLDGHLLRHILVNLFTNASKYSHNHSKICLTTLKCVDSGRVTFADAPSRTKRPAMASH